MLPKSKKRFYMGHDDGSGSVIYYNTETKKLLTSRNFKFEETHVYSTPKNTIIIAQEHGAPYEGGGTDTDTCDTCNTENKKCRTMDQTGNPQPQKRQRHDDI